MDACRTPVAGRADRCPGVLDPHEAADGRLVRVRVPGGRIDAAGLRAVADVAALGNGIVELTSRASLQIRGLAADAGQAVVVGLRSGGLLASPEHDRVRNVLASPVAGRHPRSHTATDEVVVAFDEALCSDAGLASLPGRFLFAFDDGSAIADWRRADVGLVALGSATFELWIGGRPTTLLASPHDAPRLALAAAGAFLQRAGGAWHVADLDDGARRIACALGGELRDRLPQATRDLPAGVLEQLDGRVAVTALAPLGRLSGADVLALAALAGEVRLSAARTLTIVDVARDDVHALTAALTALGLVTAPGSGWQGLSACAGLGACSGARVDVRAAATARARVRESDAPPEHWSACERGCGRPRDVAIEICATGGGLAVGDLHVGDVPAALALLADSPP